MDVLIKGMKKPTACYKCPLRTGKYCGILTENEKCADDGVLPHCPIVEISELHGRLIDADKVTKKMEKIATDAWQMKLSDTVEHTLNMSMDIIKHAPTVIETESDEHA